MIPTMILSIFIGSLWFGFAIRWHIMVVPVMAVSALSTAGLGVLAGVNAGAGTKPVYLTLLSLWWWLSCRGTHSISELAVVSTVDFKALPTSWQQRL